MDWNLTSNSTLKADLQDTQSGQFLVYWFFGSSIIFLIGFFIAKWKDKEAEKSIRGIILPMPSLFQSSTWYELILFTPNAARSGTTANVYFRITCTEQSSAVYRLTDTCSPDRKFLKAGSVACFLVSLPTYIGIPIGIHIWHDNTGEDPCWLLETVLIRNIEINKGIIFHVNRWLSIVQPCSRLSLHLRKSSDSEINEGESVEEQPQRTLFVQETNINSFNRPTCVDLLRLCINNHHIWLSLIKSSHLSLFTKKERFMTAMLSYLTIAAMIAFFLGKLQSSTLSYEGSVCVKHICIAWRKVIVSLKASLLAFLPTAILGFLFERTCLYESEKEDTSRKGAETSVSRKISTGSVGLRVKGREFRSLRGRMIYKKERELQSQHKNKDRHYNPKMLNSDSNKLGDTSATHHENDVSFERLVKTADNMSSSLLKSPQKTRRKELYHSNGTPRSRNLKHDANGSRSDKSARMTKLPTIQEGVVYESTGSGNIPKMPLLLKKLQHSPAQLPANCLRIEWIFTVIACSALAYSIWLQTQTWKQSQFEIWLIATAISILFDVLLLQFIRPIIQFLYIKRRHSNREVNILTVLRFHRNFWRHIDRQWITAHTPKNRIPYLESLQHIKISMPVDIQHERQRLKVAIAKRHALKTLPFYVVLFACFIALAVREMPVYSVRKHVENLIFVCGNSTSDSFHKVNDVPNFLDWLEKLLIPKVYVSQGVEPISWNLLGGIKITQRRIKTDQCEVAQHMKSVVRHCNGLLNNENEDRGSYGVSWKKMMSSANTSLSRDVTSHAAWTYQKNNSEIRVPMWMSWVLDRPTGYIAWLGLDSVNATQKLRSLRNDRWFDEYSRKITVELTLYSPYVDIATLVDVEVDVQATGGLKISRNIKLVNFSRSYDYQKWLKVASYSVLMIYSLCLFIRFFQRLFEWRCASIICLSSLCNVMFVILASASTSLYIAREIILNDQTMFTSSNVHIVLRQISVFDDFMSYTLSLTGLVLCMCITSNTAFTNCMQKTIQVFKMAARFILGIAVFLVLILVAFASLTHLTFCSLESFGSFFKAFSTLTSIAGFENVSISEKFDEYSVALLLVHSTLVFIVFILKCLLFAVIFTSYKSRVVRKSRPDNVSSLVQSRKDAFYSNAKQKRLDKQTDSSLPGSQINKPHENGLDARRLNGKFGVIEEFQLHKLHDFLNEFYIDGLSWDLFVFDAAYTYVKRSYKARNSRNGRLNVKASGIVKRSGKQRAKFPKLRAKEKSHFLQLPSLKDRRLALHDKSLAHESIPDLKHPKLHGNLGKLQTLLLHSRKNRVKKISIQEPQSTALRSKDIEGLTSYLSNFEANSVTHRSAQNANREHEAPPGSLVRNSFDNNTDMLIDNEPRFIESSPKSNGYTISNFQTCSGTMTPSQSTETDRGPNPPAQDSSSSTALQMPELPLLGTSEPPFVVESSSPPLVVDRSISSCTLVEHTSCVAGRRNLPPVFNQELNQSSCPSGYSLPGLASEYSVVRNAIQPLAVANSTLLSLACNSLENFDTVNASAAENCKSSELIANDTTRTTEDSVAFPEQHKNMYRSSHAQDFKPSLAEDKSTFSSQDFANRPVIVHRDSSKYNIVIDVDYLNETA